MTDHAELTLRDIIMHLRAVLPVDVEQSHRGLVDAAELAVDRIDARHPTRRLPTKWESREETARKLRARIERWV
jgi:hypothetical protein